MISLSRNSIEWDDFYLFLLFPPHFWFSLQHSDKIVNRMNGMKFHILRQKISFWICWMSESVVHKKSISLYKTSYYVGFSVFSLRLLFISFTSDIYLPFRVVEFFMRFNLWYNNLTNAYCVGLHLYKRIFRFVRDRTFTTSHIFWWIVKITKFSMDSIPFFYISKWWIAIIWNFSFGICHL